MIGLTVPILGANPIEAQIVTQIFNVFILPAVFLATIVLINRKRLMGSHQAGWKLNFGLGAALLFSILISYQGILAISNFRKV